MYLHHGLSIVRHLLLIITYFVEPIGMVRMVWSTLLMGILFINQVQLGMKHILYQLVWGGIPIGIIIMIG